jgi:hypothetical protein
MKKGGLVCTLLLLALVQRGHSQHSVSAGASISNASSLGYTAPTLGAWGQWRGGPVRVLGEWRKAEKWWVGDGWTWGVRGSLDSPAWRGLSALAVGGVVQHRNSQWTKAGGYYGGGLRWGPAYSWYSPADTSPNRVSTWLAGVELTGTGRWAPAVAVEYQRLWFCCTGASSGWSVALRVGLVSSCRIP